MMGGQCGWSGTYTFHLQSRRSSLRRHRLQRGPAVYHAPSSLKKPPRIRCRATTKLLTSRFFGAMAKNSLLKNRDDGRPIRRSAMNPHRIPKADFLTPLPSLPRRCKPQGPSRPSTRPGSKDSRPTTAEGPPPPPRRGPSRHVQGIRARAITTERQDPSYSWTRQQKRRPSRHIIFKAIAKCRTARGAQSLLGRHIDFFVYATHLKDNLERRTLHLVTAPAAWTSQSLPSKPDPSHSTTSRSARRIAYAIRQEGHPRRCVSPERCRPGRPSVADRHLPAYESNASVGTFDVQRRRTCGLVELPGSVPRSTFW